MCLLITEPIIRVSDGTAHCYKVLRNFEGKLIAPYMFYEYKLHKIQPEVQLVLRPTTYSDKEGKFLTEIQDGYHSFPSIEDYNKSYAYSPSLHRESCCLHLCSVPKGSIYMISGHHRMLHKEMVSSSIIIHRKAGL